MRNTSPRSRQSARARTPEIQSGNMDGYDWVTPADVLTLKNSGFQFLNRPAFNILYMGMNQQAKAPHAGQGVGQTAVRRTPDRVPRPVHRDHRAGLHTAGRGARPEVEEVT